jgi:hypothetical protein
MENSFQTSFIPKKPIVSNLGGDKEPRSLFSWIAIFLLIVSIVTSIVLFFYKIYLTKQRVLASESLILARDSFEKETIDELELFDKRTESAKAILGNHIVFSPMFALLGDITIPSIQYTNFAQQTSDGGYIVNMEGRARDYRSIALQADMFNSVRGRSFNNVLFSNLMKDKNNNISFDLKFNVDPDLLSYEKNVLKEQGISSNSDTTSTTLSGGLGNQTQ